MKRFLLSGVAVLAALSSAFAADLPVKAPAPSWAFIGNPCQIATATTPLSCTGLYIGAGIAGQGSNADIVGNGINGSVFAGGMVPTVDVGYQYAQGKWIFAAEFDLGYAMGSAATIAGAGSNMNGLRMTELFKAGGNLQALLGTQTPITIPPVLANAVIAPYVGVGQTQWQLVNAWANGTVGAAGVLFDIGPYWFGDLRYSYTDFSAAKSQGIVINNDQSLLVTVNRKF